MTIPRLAAALALLIFVVGGAAADVRTIDHDGRPYVDLVKLAAAIKAKVDAKDAAIHAELRVGRHVVRFTRNWRQIVVDGDAAVLDAPVRVKDGRWIVPKSFVAEIVPRLTGQSTRTARGGLAVGAAAGRQ